MKKILFSLLLVGLILSSFLFASHYFRYELYEIAIDYESNKANLLPSHKTLNGLNYYYLSRDRGPKAETVVLLHGFSANKENWLSLGQHLPENLSIYAIDLLGHGEHPIDLSINYSIETQVDYLHLFITKHIQHPVHLIGNSMGGAIASLYAAKYPHNIKTLMLISPAGIHDIPSEFDHSLEQGHNPLIASSVEEFSHVLDFVMEQPPFIPKPILTVQAERSIQRHTLNQKIFSDIRNDLTKHLDQNFSFISSPTLILWGQEDRVINAKNINQYTSLIPNSTPMTLEGIGHLAMIEAPKVAAQAFMTLLSTTHQELNE